MQMPKWLPHLENTVPPKGYGNRLSMYLIALEAWRRGATLKFYSYDNPENKLRIRCLISYQGREHVFEGSRGDKLPKATVEITENKDETKKYLAQAGVPVPEGKRFKEIISDEEIISYTNTLGYPIVLKPVDEKAGNGVVPNIQSEQELIESLKYVRETLNYKDVLIEKFIPGVEYRILMINGKVAAAMNRIPANIVGDGKHTIKQLISLKNESRKVNPNISKNIIKIDNEILRTIKKLEYDLESIPEKGEVLSLRNKSNISTGGDPIDVTDELTDELKEIAIKAVHAIPDLDICGLDMIVDKQNNTGTIIEINTKQALGLHIYPVKGIARDVTKMVIDYYFPETIENKRTNLYFDFEKVTNTLDNISFKEIVILPPPSLEKLYGKRYIVSGKTDKSYEVRLRRQALINGLHGFIEKLPNGTYEIVVVGTDLSEVNSFKEKCSIGLDGEIEEMEWYKPVKIGFEIRRKTIEDYRELLRVESKEKAQLKNELKVNQEENRLKINSLENKITEISNKVDHLNNHIKIIESQKKSLRKSNAKLEEQVTHTLKEKEQIQLKYRRLKNSRSWRYTEPIRTIIRYVKK